jgi:hypothetical protein
VKRAVLVRVRGTSKETLGHLFLFDDAEMIYHCVTLEPPWRDNRKKVSCIPEGDYKLTPRAPADSPKFKYPHFIVGNTGERSCILMHRGNFSTQTQGCILVGWGFKDIDGDGEPDVVDSTATLTELVRLIDSEIHFKIV